MTDRHVLVDENGDVTESDDPLPNTLLHMVLRAQLVELTGQHAADYWASGLSTEAAEWAREVLAERLSYYLHEHDRRIGAQAPTARADE